jgi:hypothetical protein
MELLSVKQTHDDPNPIVARATIKDLTALGAMVFLR